MLVRKKCSLYTQMFALRQPLGMDRFLDLHLGVDGTHSTRSWCKRQLQAVVHIWRLLHGGQSPESPWDTESPDDTTKVWFVGLSIRDDSRVGLTYSLGSQKKHTGASTEFPLGEGNERQIDTLISPLRPPCTVALSHGYLLLVESFELKQMQHATEEDQTTDQAC